MTAGRSFVIWSEEHGAWWGADETNFNYTRSLLKARRYTEVMAYAIVDDASRYLRPGEPLHEVAIPDPIEPRPHRPARLSTMAVAMAPQPEG